MAAKNESLIWQHRGMSEQKHSPAEQGLKAADSHNPKLQQEGLGYLPTIQNHGMVWVWIKIISFHTPWPWV